MSESKKEKAVKGVVWSAVERFSTQGVSFILSIILARLVAPHDYGLIAMLAIFMVIAQTFIDSGFSNALIQKQDRTETDYSTVFYFNIAISVGIYLLLFIVAPYIALFYREPLLTPVTRWIGLNILIAAFSIVQRAKLTIELNFKTQAKASFISVIIGGGIGVSLAYQGYGVWALVIQSLLTNIFNTILLWGFARWIPKRTYSRQSFQTLFAFGSRLLLSGLLHNIYINLYSLVIGRQYNATDVGYYNRASSLSQFPSTNITEVITRAIYPIQCEIQNDDERLRLSFIQYLRLSIFLIFPLMIGLCTLSKPLVLLFLTDKWSSIITLLQILCIAYMWYPIMIINCGILKVKGRTDYFLRAEIIKKICAISILIFTLPYGLKLLCWGLFFYSIIDMVIIMFFTKQVIDIGYWTQIKNIVPIALLAFGMGINITLVISFIENLILQLAIGFTTGVISFIVYAYIFRFKEVETFQNLIKNKIITNNNK